MQEPVGSVPVVVGFSAERALGTQAAGEQCEWVRACTVPETPLRALGSVLLCGASEQHGLETLLGSEQVCPGEPKPGMQLPWLSLA